MKPLVSGPQNLDSLDVDKGVYPFAAEWINQGIALAQDASGHQWAVADWMLYGEENLAGDPGFRLSMQKVYDLAEKATGYSRKTLQEWAYVARHVSIRMENLTFGHHQVVAGLTPEAQKECLEYAVAHGFAIGDLREMARWQPRPLKINTEKEKELWQATLLLRFESKRILDLLEITARQKGFISDENSSAACRLIWQLIREFLESNPEIRKATVSEYNKEVEKVMAA